MKIILTPSQARTLKLHEHYEFVRAAFYLGFGLTQIEEYIDSDNKSGERQNVVSQAFALGMLATDTVEVI